MNETEKKLLDLILEEKKNIRSLDSQFEMLGYIFKGCDPKNKTLLLATYVCQGGIVEGEPDVTTTIEDPYPIPIDEIRDEIDDNLHPDVPRHINELMEVSQSIINLKSEIPENRVRELYDNSKQYQEILELHEEIKKIQNDYRDILEGIIEGLPLTEISQLDKFIKTYYQMPTTKLITFGDFLMEVPPINEDNYIRIKSKTGWWLLLRNELAYLMVEFLRGEYNRKYFKKCHQCNGFYISKTLASSKYCSDKCRMAYHNRKRIKSGEAREYKRRKRMEGAKESYYG
jgi:hypothetical protein